MCVFSFSKLCVCNIFRLHLFPIGRREESSVVVCFCGRKTFTTKLCKFVVKFLSFSGEKNPQFGVGFFFFFHVWEVKLKGEDGCSPATKQLFLGKKSRKEELFYCRATIC